MAYYGRGLRSRWEYNAALAAEAEALQAARYWESLLHRGGDLYSSAMGNISGGSVTFNNNGYRPTPGVDHISVYSADANARVSWNMQNGELAPDQYGEASPHGYDQTARKPF